MSKPLFYRTLRLEWSQINRWMSEHITMILGRGIICKALVADRDYWSISLVDSKFSISELYCLLAHVPSDNHMVVANIPEDSTYSRSIDISLSEAILARILCGTWDHSLITEEALFLIGASFGIRLPPPLSANICHVDSMDIDCSKLMGKDELVEELFDRGGTFTDLTDLCERYVKEFGNELNWYYPITDGQYNGVYFVLVREGVLCLPYNVVDCEDHEFFESQGVRLCNAEEIGYFIYSWENHTESLMASLKSLHSFLLSKEVTHE